MIKPTIRPFGIKLNQDSFNMCVYIVTSIYFDNRKSSRQEIDSPKTMYQMPEKMFCQLTSHKDEPCRQVEYANQLPGKILSLPR